MLDDISGRKIYARFNIKDLEIEVDTDEFRRAIRGIEDEAWEIPGVESAETHGDGETIIMEVVWPDEEARAADKDSEQLRDFCTAVRVFGGAFYNDLTREQAQAEFKRMRDEN